MLLIIQLNCDGFWAWPWPIILAFILGAILGWLLSKILGGDSKNEDHEYRQRYLDTKAELDLCRRDIKTNANSDLAGANALGIASSNNEDEDKYKNKYLDTKAALEACRKNVNVGNSNSLAASKATDGSVRDDLTKVEGIGPKIQGLLYDDGIYTWVQLSEIAVDRIQKILDDAGPRYRVHNPGSWPKQAGMCARGEWEKLKIWQDEHKGGRE